MDIGVISVRYARALLKSATELKVEEKVYADMIMLAACYVEVADLRATIENPMLLRSEKVRLLTTALGPDANELSKRFIELVLKEGREKVLQFMANSYITFYREQKNIIRGKLTTAAAVSEATEQKMKQMSIFWNSPLLSFPLLPVWMPNSPSPPNSRLSSPTLPSQGFFDMQPVFFPLTYHIR